MHRATRLSVGRFLSGSFCSPSSSAAGPASGAATTSCAQLPRGYGGP